jgi:hypothetical protein
MPDNEFRYPGAQPFRDDDVARQTFFGRDAAAVELSNQILANRLVVVYAKSGVGKTSLLNAGVAPKLRDANTIPLLVRVNDTEHALIPSVLERIRTEAARQKIEYHPGEASSLWDFFKTVQFWRGDLLLRPVLIIDQFEELFTLQPEDPRQEFLSQLSYVARGVAPPEASENTRSDAPARVHVVLSLREDFLGLLEEASDRIPQILDHRFRLAPLDRDTATAAITCPAALDDPHFATRPFQFAPDVVPTILNYLSKSASAGRKTSSKYIEPFHLQLICQRIERIVAEKQKQSSAMVEFSLTDLGGEAALAETLAGFYEDAIHSLKGMRLRGAARRLCEQFLISPEGRRLSMEEDELHNQLNLPSEALQQLVDRRLLRSDRRAESTYYELSHDALIQPVLASGRTQGLLLAWANLLAGGIVSVLALFCVFAAIFDVVTKIKAIKAENVAIEIFFVLVGGCVGAFSVGWMRSGLQLRRRYRKPTVSDAVAKVPVLQT